MTAPKPITVTYVSEANYVGGFDPQPFEIVGDAPQSPIDPVELTDVPGVFADLDAVRTYLATLVTELRESEIFE
jgi:hypothetical protein